MPRRDDLIELRVQLRCPAGHTLGQLIIDRDTHHLDLIARSFDVHGPGAGHGEPVHYAAGKLRYRCPSCVRTAHGHGWPPPPPRSVPWRSMAALLAALAVLTEGNRTVTATAAAVREAWRALIPDGTPRPDGYAEYWDAWRPRHAGE